VNHFEIKTTRTGTFKGKCYELCGVYHSRMLFEVKVVSREDYEAHLQDLQDQGLESDLPILGGREAHTQAGLESKGGSE
jgi:cytochrome c oxidase subunit 2